MHGQGENPETALDRRRFLQAAGGVAAAASFGGSLAWPKYAVAREAKRDDDEEHREAPLPAAKPIPGGIQIPGGPQIHVWAPGPTDVTLPFSGSTLQGLDYDPSPITDRTGFSALAFHAGTATGSDGKSYNVETDIRAFDVKYIAADGTRQSGTFAFI